MAYSEIEQKLTLEAQMSLPSQDKSERRSLEYFRDHMEELAASVRATGRPIVLTGHDEDEFVLLDASAFARMKAEVDELASMRAIQQGIDAAKGGDVMLAEEFFAGLKEKIAIHR
jgi:PHD/YefM family antitoxin component YafN of YafNO toxin-antitoxin module